MRKDKYVVMIIGKTHSGKTTFAEDLKKDLRGSVVIQTDPIVKFLTKNFPKKIFLKKCIKAVILVEILKSQL